MQQKPRFTMGIPGIVGMMLVGILIGIGLTFAVLVATSVHAPQSDSSSTISTPTVSHRALQPTHVPTMAVIPTKTAASGGQSVTHGRPQLAGPVSDFQGTYGQMTPEPVSGDGSITVIWTDPDGNGLIVHYLPSNGLVNYIAYNGPATWGKDDYKSKLLTYAPDGSSAIAGSDPYDPAAYTSPILNRFFLHVSDGSGWMNSI